MKTKVITYLSAQDKTKFNKPREIKPFNIPSKEKTLNPLDSKKIILFKLLIIEEKPIVIPKTFSPIFLIAKEIELAEEINTWQTK